VIRVGNKGLSHHKGGYLVVRIVTDYCLIQIITYTVIYC